ncbi:MAG TPA: chromate transporter [Ramlibacter sp.]|uniref:chromate transporter n=1 Tax=Ramlibacter sp. TaxID=1917967 RepID=UPI002C056AE2|nr:chromate transporter [Ramlibacter sp.]HVZ44681.1 chromate transporter [Ramlibacter sp.]
MPEAPRAARPAKTATPIPMTSDAARSTSPNGVTQPESTTAAEAERPRPASLSELFISLTILALQGFGGVLAVVQRELVERRGWMTQEEFVEEWAVAQILPGPNVVNLGIMLGNRWFGWRGAIVGVLGLIAVPLLVVLVLALVYAQFAGNAHVAGALRGMGAVAAGLITATGVKLFGTLRTHPLGVPACLVLGALTFAGVAILRWPLAWVLLGLGGLSCVLTYARLAR